MLSDSLKKLFTVISFYIVFFLSLGHYGKINKTLYVEMFQFGQLCLIY